MALDRKTSMMPMVYAAEAHHHISTPTLTDSAHSTYQHLRWNCMCWLIFHHEQRWFLWTKNSDKYSLKNIMLLESLPSQKKKLHVVVPSSKQLLHKKQGSYHCSCAFSYETKTSPLILHKDLLERARLTKINVTHNKVSTIKIISSAIMRKIENILLCT